MSECHAPIEVQKEQFRRVVVNQLTYSELCLCVNRLRAYNAINESTAEKYKRWYRRMKRGEM